MKVAIYTRVSGKSNRQDAANQSLQLIEFCNRQGWEYVEYTDRMSGTRADRAAFMQMFEDARLKKFELVLFWALDRFSREGVTETLNHLKVLDSYGVEWKSFTESYLFDRHVQRSRYSDPSRGCSSGTCPAVGTRCSGPTEGQARRQGAGPAESHCGSGEGSGSPRGRQVIACDRLAVRY